MNRIPIAALGALAVLGIVSGFALLIWSADRFVEGAAATAKHAGMPSLLIGMVIVGFGTSAPEMVVSALAASQGNPGIALGNAYGSNITNIALILGLTAFISPYRIDRDRVRNTLEPGDPAQRGRVSDVDHPDPVVRVEHGHRVARPDVQPPGERCGVALDEGVQHQRR